MTITGAWGNKNLFQGYCGTKMEKNSLSWEFSIQCKPGMKVHYTPSALDRWGMLMPPCKTSSKKTPRNMLVHPHWSRKPILHLTPAVPFTRDSSWRLKHSYATCSSRPMFPTVSEHFHPFWQDLKIKWLELSFLIFIYLTASDLGCGTQDLCSITRGLALWCKDSLVVAHKLQSCNSQA